MNTAVWNIKYSVYIVDVALKSCQYFLCLISHISLSFCQHNCRYISHATHTINWFWKIKDKFVARNNVWITGYFRLFIAYIWEILAVGFERAREGGRVGRNTTSRDNTRLCRLIDYHLIRLGGAVIVLVSRWPAISSCSYLGKRLSYHVNRSLVRAYRAIIYYRAVK